MSGDVLLFRGTMVLGREVMRLMKNKTDLSDDVSSLLFSKASAEEKKRLEEMEFRIKNPTRMTVIAATLYSKAANGELSAIKELLSIVGLVGNTGGVTLVDDIGKS